MKRYIAWSISCFIVVMTGLVLVLHDPPKGNAEYGEADRTIIKRWGNVDDFWINEDVDRSNITQSATATLKAGTVEVQSGIIIIRETEDEASLPTPATGSFLLYGWENDAGEKTVRMLSSTEIISEVYVKDTSTAVDARDAWAATYPDNYPFIASIGTTKYLLDIPIIPPDSTDVMFWPSMFIRSTTDATIANPEPALFWGGTTMRIMNY